MSKFFIAFRFELKKVEKFSLSNFLKYYWTNEFLNSKKVQPLVSYYPHTVIKDRIPFNKNGLYLIAEENTNLNRFHNFKNFFLGGKMAFFSLLVISYPLNIYWNLFFLIICYQIFFTFKNFERRFERNKIIGKIYLCDNLRDILVQTSPYTCLHRLSIEELYSATNESEFKFILPKFNSGIPFQSNDNKASMSFTLSDNMIIYDREIFLSVLRGYPISIEEQQSVSNKYISAECTLIPKNNIL